MSKKDKKKLKKNTMYGEMSLDEQMMALEELDNAIYNGGDISEVIEDSDDSVFDSFMKAISKAEMNKSFSISDNTEVLYDNIGSTEDNDTEETVASEQINENDYRGIKINISDDEFKILTISDGIKSISIDLNTIGSDMADYEGNTDYDQTEKKLYLINQQIPSLLLSDIVVHFYPSAIINRSIISDIVVRVKEYDSYKFYFFDTTNTGSQLVSVYYIDSESYKVYKKLTDDLIYADKFLEFANALLEIIYIGGFSFLKLDEAYRRQLSLLSRMNDSDKFISMFIGDEETELAEFDEDLSQCGIPILPPIFSSRAKDIVDTYVNAVLYDSDDDEDDSDDEEDDLDDDDEYDDEDDSDDDEESEDVEDTEDDGSDDDDSNIVDEDPDTLVIDTRPDPITERIDEDERLAAQYGGYSSKEYRQNKKKPPKNSSDDDSFTIPRKFN